VEQWLGVLRVVWECVVEQWLGVLRMHAKHT